MNQQQRNGRRRDARQARGLPQGLGALATQALAQGAEPLMFLDYFATGKLDIDTAAAVVGGIANGCTEAGCALIGGETAEMPDMYEGEDYDLAGFCVGVVEKSEIIDGSRVQAGHPGGRGDGWTHSMQPPREAGARTQCRRSACRKAESDSMTISTPRPMSDVQLRQNGLRRFGAGASIAGTLDDIRRM